MTTLEELQKLRQLKKQVEEQKKIDQEAEKIREVIESTTLKGKLKKIGKGLFDSLMK